MVLKLDQKDWCFILESVTNLFIMLDEHSRVPRLVLRLGKDGELDRPRTPGLELVLEQGLQNPLLSMGACHLRLQGQLIQLIYIYFIYLLIIIYSL